MLVHFAFAHTPWENNDQHIVRAYLQRTRLGNVHLWHVLRFTLKRNPAHPLNTAVAHSPYPINANPYGIPRIDRAMVISNVST